MENKKCLKPPTRYTWAFQLIRGFVGILLDGGWGWGMFIPEHNMYIYNLYIYICIYYTFIYVYILIIIGRDPFPYGKLDHLDRNLGSQ
jgi:hypothetical protein